MKKIISILILFLNQIIFCQSKDTYRTIYFEDTKNSHQTYLYFISLICVLVISFLFFLWQHLVIKQKLTIQSKLLKEEAISKMKQQQEISVAKALLSGQEQERKRLARELHDGIGAMLASLKINISNLNSSLKNVNLEHSIDLLDTTIQELRMVSHDMMPESILNYGLKKSLEDYFSELQRNLPQQVIKLEIYGIWQHLSQEKELTLYRIITELTTNALKHSMANEILAQVVFDESSLNITVEDNGNGFDTELSHLGIGLKNIQSRIKFLNATMEIDSNEKGTSFLIHVPIN